MIIMMMMMMMIMIKNKITIIIIIIITIMIIRVIFNEGTKLAMAVFSGDLSFHTI